MFCYLVEYFYCFMDLSFNLLFLGDRMVDNIINCIRVNVFGICCNLYGIGQLGSVFFGLCGRHIAIKSICSAHSRRNSKCCFSWWNHTFPSWLCNNCCYIICGVCSLNRKHTNSILFGISNSSVQCKCFVFHGWNIWEMFALASQWATKVNFSELVERLSSEPCQNITLCIRVMISQKTF